MFLTFVASGLYHEFCWIPIFYYPKYLYDENSDYEYKFGRVTAFFAYTGIIMLLERPMRKLPVVQRIASHLPTLVVSQLLVLIHVPVLKWYGGDWIEGESSFVGALHVLGERLSVAIPLDVDIRISLTFVSNQFFYRRTLRRFEPHVFPGAEKLEIDLLYNTVPSSTRICYTASSNFECHNEATIEKP